MANDGIYTEMLNGLPGNGVYRVVFDARAEETSLRVMYRGSVKLRTRKQSSPDGHPTRCYVLLDSLDPYEFFRNVALAHHMYQGVLMYQAIC